MKKSRIIIPALAMIAFSMAASITGAVAWFTATRTATVTSGAYAVVKTSSNLAVSISGDVGTAVNSTDDHQMDVNAKLTDGSFDHSAKKVYTPDETGSKIKSVTALADVSTTTMERGETNDNPAVPIYTAVTWDITFTIDFGSASGDIGLFLDTSLDNNVARSRFTYSNETADQTATGFRMAFVANEANGQTKVFAGLQSSSNCTFINSGAAGDALADHDEGAYGSTELIDSSFHGGANGLPESFATRADATGRVDYFGVFAYAANTQVSLSYKVVCWFEGTDPNVINDKVLQSVSAILQFKAINIPAAPANNG